MTAAELRQQRLVGAIPVLLGFTVHALAHANPWGPMLLGTILSWSVWTDRHVALTKTRLALVAGAGWLSGAAMLASGAIPPDRPFPPNLWCGAIGVLLALTTLLTAARQIVWALGTTLGVVVFSLNVEFDAPLLLSLCVFLAGFLASTAALTGTLRIEASFLLPFAIFVAAATMATIGVHRVIDRFGGTIDRALGRLFMDNLATSRTGIGGDVLLPVKHRLRPTTTPLLELSAPVSRLRAHTLDLFDGRRWTTSRDTLNTLRNLAAAPRDEQQVRTLELLPLADLHGRLPTPGGLWDIQGAVYTIDGGWAVRGEASAPAVTMIGDRRELLPVENRPDVELRYTERLQASLRESADQIVDGAAPARRQAEAIERHFHDHFTYSLDTDLAGDAHPLLVLLRERRPASCTYFAGAMAAMLQARKLPARVVTGYVPRESNRWTGRTVVRDRDAHAWVEVWLPEERRFVTFDPTPWRSREAAVGRAEASGWLSSLFDAARSWIRRFGLALWHDPWRLLGDALQRPWSWPLLALIALLAWRRWRGWRRSARRPLRLAHDDPRLRRCYAEYLESLRRAGVTASGAESDDELLARLERERGEPLAAHARAFLEKYRPARYRGDTFDDELVRSARF